MFDGTTMSIMQMDKASIIKDAIGYIQELRAEENQIETEISNLESNVSKSTTSSEDDDHGNNNGNTRKRGTNNCNRQIREKPSSFPIEILDVRI